MLAIKFSVSPEWDSEVFLTAGIKIPTFKLPVYICYILRFKNDFSPSVPLNPAMT